ncbi:MAG TPA: HAD family hydrolase [Saprospiraceae bacterium]|nr:HAD family hydrolase [Saprospiraceae bacterium]
MDLNKVRIVCFDADDTLWANEPYYQEAEQKFCTLLESYLPQHTTAQELFRTEMQNLPLYGYGIKAFTLSMIETALRITDHHAPADLVDKIIGYGKVMLDQPIELFPGVTTVLQQLSHRYRLVIATKGDLLDQERKLKKSGIAAFFHHVEIMSDKKDSDYHKLLGHLDCRPEQFVMVGNSLKSDIMPVLAIGGYAIHIPYHMTWAHEVIQDPVEHERMLTLESIDQIIQYFR